MPERWIEGAAEAASEAERAAWMAFGDGAPGSAMGSSRCIMLC